MTAKEIAALDKKIEDLKPKLFKAHKEYEELTEKMSELIKHRYIFLS